MDVPVHGSDGFQGDAATGDAMLPFSQAQFLAVFAHYNAAVWPAQLIAYLVGLIIVGALVRRTAASGRIIGVALGCMWIWTGAVYHGLYFSAINKAAFAFGAFFVMQGVGLIYGGLAKRFEPGLRPEWSDWGKPIGWFLVVYSIVIYPLVGIAAGHRLLELPMFGITPCPVTIFTFGVMLLVRSAVPRWLLVVPAVWTLVGGSAAFLLGVPQDWLLLATGIVAMPLLLRQRVLRSVGP
jgi:hypothetical protein